MRCLCDDDRRDPVRFVRFFFILLSRSPISDEQIESVVGAIEGQVYDQFVDEIDTRSLGELVMEQLAQLDQVAYVRFASVYREFKDVRDFVDELKPMLQQQPQAPTEE